MAVTDKEELPAWMSALLCATLSGQLLSLRPGVAPQDQSLGPVSYCYWEIVGPLRGGA